jgi:hypothetical protein
MKYIVGENASFIANGRIYKPGDEIDSELFKFTQTLQAAVSAGKLKLVEDNTDGGDPDGDNTPGGGGNASGGDTTSGNPGGGDNTPGGGNTGDTGLTPKKRKALEKALIDNGLRSPEEIKNLSDKDLAELLASAGVVV